MSDVQPPLNPNALSITEAAGVLSKVSGKHVSAEWIEADLAAGAPANADGTVNLVRYAAWLLKEMGRGD